MLEQSNDISYNKIKQCTISLPGDCLQQEAGETNKCKNVEYQMIMVNI